MKITIVLSFILLISMAAFSQSDEQAKILAMENLWNTAQSTHDSQTLDKILADTFIDTEADGSVMNKGQFLAYIKNPDVKHIALTNSDVKVNLFGSGTALVIGTYHDKGTENGKPYEVHGRFTDTWVRINGQWRCVATASTPVSGR